MATETLLLHVISRELALELAKIAFIPVVAQCLLNIANTKSEAFPSFLKRATPVFPPVREAAYFCTVTNPVMPAKVGNNFRHASRGLKFL